MLKQSLRDGPPGIELADKIVGLGLHIFEEDLAKIGLTADQHEGRDRDPRLMKVKENKADSVVLWSVGIGSNEAEDPVSVMSTCRPDLGTVDDVVIILAHGPSLKAGEIGSGAGFAVALTPQDFATGDFG